jgi:hypothetical protein
MLSGIYSVIGLSSWKTAKRQKTGVDSAPQDRPPATARNGIRFPAAQKKDMPSTASKQASKAAKELKIFRRKEMIYSLIMFCLFSLLFPFLAHAIFKERTTSIANRIFQQRFAILFFFFSVLRKI